MADINWIIGGITGVATVTLAIITWCYARHTKDYVSLTREILEENRQMRLDAQKTEIAIYLRLEKETINLGEPKAAVMNLYVDNIGMGSAYDVRFDTDLSFSLPSNRSLEDVPFFQHGIRYLPPRQNRKYLLGHEWHINNQFDELMQKQFEIEVTYKDSVSKKYKNCFCLDFREHSGK